MPVPAQVSTAIPTRVPTYIPSTLIPKPMLLQTPEPTPAIVPTALPTPGPTIITSPTATSPPVRRTDIGPHVFVGTATIDGQPATDGTAVTGWVDEFGFSVGDGVVSTGIYDL